jgi:hypothetical protein
MANIIWLASYPKSGNVWLQAFLHNLISNSRQAPSPEKIGGFCTPESAALHFMTPDSRPLGAWTREETARRRAGAHKAITGLRSDNVFASTRAALVESGGAPTITMEHTAAAIYLVRNPLDVAVSLAAQGDRSIDEAILHLETEYESENSDQFAYEYQGSWSTNVLSWTQQRHAGLHLLRYEDMLSVPEQAFGPLASFLGFDTSPERLARAIRFSSFADLAEEEDKSTFTSSSGGVRRVLRVGKSDQWREVLSADQVRRVVDRHDKQMERFNYIPNDY